MPWKKKLQVRLLLRVRNVAPTHQKPRDGKLFPVHQKFLSIEGQPDPSGRTPAGSCASAYRAAPDALLSENMSYMSLTTWRDRWKHNIWRFLRRIVPRRLRSRLAPSRESPFGRFSDFPPATEGVLAVSLTRRAGDGRAEGEPNERLRPVIHQHVWQRGPHYSGMEDNDIRGFLDGRFVAGWNQPEQIHVRLGRVYSPWVRFGENELFRVLQRWEGIRLPEGSEVHRARLELTVEEGAERSVEVLLYEVLKDWKPGHGGLEGNNNSPPRKEEVWWNERARGVTPWGLPGAGFAADDRADADTPMAPLAVAPCGPGKKRIVFSSSRLTSYVNDRIASRKPLLFLLKLSDYLEDVPGTCISFYSANHGDSRNPDGRPRLLVEWTCPSEVEQLEMDVLLEYGRSLILPCMNAERIDGVVASFKSNPDGMEPTIRIRGGCGDEGSPWKESTLELSPGWTWAQVRVDAWHNEVLVGHPFVADVRDTWITTGPPEEQRLMWTFVSPSGRRQTQAAEYVGDYRWRVRFLPEELGRWTYHWTHRFLPDAFRSTEGSFDVVPGDARNALEALASLVERIRGSGLPAGRPRRDAFGVPFYRLERALMKFADPTTFPMRADGPDGGEIGAAIDDAREALEEVRPRQPRLLINMPSGVSPKR